jgi:hypothetical protein
MGKAWRTDMITSWMRNRIFNRTPRAAEEFPPVKRESGDPGCDTNHGQDLRDTKMFFKEYFFKKIQSIIY